MAYELFFSQQAEDDWEFLKTQKNPDVVHRLQRLLDQLRIAPFAPYPPYKKLRGQFGGLWARRLTLEHRVIYQIIEDRKAVKVVSMRTHSDN